MSSETKASFERKLMNKIIFAALIALSTSSAFAAEKIDVAVKGLVCGFCAQGIEKTFNAMPAVENVKVSLKEKHVMIGTRTGATLPDTEITKALEAAGFTVLKIDRKNL